MTRTKAYLILQAAVWIVLVVLLSVSALTIYQEGMARKAEHPLESIYTREIAAEKFAPIAPLFFASLGLMIAGLVMGARDEEADRPVRDAELTRDLMVARVAQPSQAMRQEQALQKRLLLAGWGAFAVCMIPIVLYITNPEHFPLANLEEMFFGLIRVVIPWTVLGLGALAVTSVGVIYSSAFVPCLIASLIALQIASLAGIPPEGFEIPIMVPLHGAGVLRVAGLALLCTVVSIVFCLTMHGTEHFLRKKIPNDFVRVVFGGCVIVGLTLLLGTGDFNGAGMGVIERAIEEGSVRPDAFFWKLVFTAITLGTGYKGGEVVPCFFVGATFGCAVGPLLGLPAGFAAAIGLVCVFCGAVNCPLASILLAVELFDSADIVYFALACGLAYMLSGYFGLYSSQKIMYSKLKAEFINIHAR